MASESAGCGIRCGPYATTALTRRELTEGLEAIPLLQRLLSILVAVLIIVWIVANPAAAGDTVHSWITGILTFFRHLA